MEATGICMYGGDRYLYTYGGDRYLYLCAFTHADTSKLARTHARSLVRAHHICNHIYNHTYNHI